MQAMHVGQFIQNFLHSTIDKADFNDKVQFWSPYLSSPPSGNVLIVGDYHQSSVIGIE